MAWILVAVSLVTVSLLGVVGAFNSPPQTFDAAASADTYLSSYSPSSPHGTAPVLWVSQDGSENWTLIAFDTAGKLRPGDLVVGARIGLTVSGMNATSPSVVLTTGRALTAWQENSATFNDPPLFAFDTSTATTVGTSHGTSRGSTVWIDVTKQLARWHSYGGPSNFGTVIMIGAGGAHAAIGFASRENTQLQKPVLEITFQPGPRTVYPYTLGAPAVGIAVARTN